MSTSGSLGDGGLTGKVGTALYVSPEMMDTKAKAHYNQVTILTGTDAMLEYLFFVYFIPLHFYMITHFV